MLVFWLMWLSLVLGVAVGCLFIEAARRGRWLKLARLPVRKHPVREQSDGIPPAFFGWELGIMPRSGEGMRSRPFRRPANVRRPSPDEPAR